MHKKDLQIIEILAQNCRTPNATIAKAIRISKDTVAYKINKLENEEFIKEYVLFVDARKLGFTRYHLLLKFDAGLKNKLLLIGQIKQHPFVMWINSFIGRYDLQIIVDAKNAFELDRIRKQIFSILENKIKEYFILTHLMDLEFTQLNPILDQKTRFQRKLDQSFGSIATKRKFPVNQEFKKAKLIKKDLDILQILANNPRESLTKISRTLEINRATTKSRILNLIKDEVILNFGGIPNLSKLGFVTYYLLVRIEQGISVNILKKPFRKLQNIFYAGKMIGNYDMILYLNARTPQELNKSIEMFKSEIEQHIKSYELLVQDKVYHWRQFTQGIYESKRSEF